MGTIGGVLSWIATNFLGHPLTRFFRLRDDVHSSLIQYANVSPVYERKNPREHPDWDRFIEVHCTLRRLASELRALALNHVLIARMLGCFGYRLIDAATDLFGFANTLATSRRSSLGRIGLEP